jgi:YtcA family
MMDRTARPYRIAAQTLGSTALLALLSGCQRAPDFNILGSYFQGWLVCIVAGIVLTVLARSLLLRWRLERELKVLPLIYLSLTLFFACTLWLILYE